MTAAGGGGVVLDLVRVILGDGRTDHGLLTLVIDGRQHVPTCGYGQWLTPGGPRPEGDPCSARCVAVHAALDAAEAWLRSVETVPAQASLLDAIEEAV